MKRTKFVAGAAVFSAAIVGSMVMATQASAAPASATAAYNGACGSGYGVVNSAPITNKGTVYLTYNNSTGKNCVVTVRNTSGAKIYMGASVARSDGSSGQISDYGNYTSYAGPVYVDAKGACVDWSGTIEEVTVSTTNSNCGEQPTTVTTYAR